MSAPPAGTSAELAAALARLRLERRAGALLSYREIAARAGWSHGIVGEYLGGRVLPPPDRLDLLLRLLGATPAERQSLNAARDRLEDPQAAPVGAAIRQLPAGVGGFTGRRPALDELDRLLGAAGPSPAVVISAVSGMAGIGKTTLAVHWAHRIADRFPDGSLYVNLRGYDPGGREVAPADALRGFLEILGVAAARMPADEPALTALYRSTLADRRMVIVLDNAASSGQVRPLLPGAPGCLVVVTSRDQFTDLAAEGAHPVRLGRFTAGEAESLLSARLGDQRVRAEPAAVADLVALCAGLPLALVVAAAHAAVRPDTPLSVLAGELRAAALDFLRTGDDGTDVRGVFSWSYRRLSAGAARLFRVLCGHPGPDIALPAVAGAGGIPFEEADDLLNELTTAHLVEERTPGRFAAHDLLRAYGKELWESTDPAADREADTRRAFDHHLHTAHAAALLINPHRDAMQMPLAAIAPGCTPEAVPDRAAALAWFAAELPTLRAMIDLAAATGGDATAWQLAWTLTDFLNQRSNWTVELQTQTVALAAAERLGHVVGRARATRYLGRANAMLQRPDAALPLLRRSLELYEGLSAPVGAARCHLNIAWVHDRQGAPESALHAYEVALGLFRTAGHRIGIAYALNGIGWLQSQLGRLAEALATCEEALVVQRELDDRFSEMCLVDTIGTIHHRLGDQARAAEHFRRAVAYFAETGNEFLEADILVRLGDTHEAAGDPAAARATWRLALELFDRLGHPAADQLRGRLEPVG
ncbi:hypothetical protein Asp14428_66690 [Actinoplanes sp. NBRC 14428]|nr:hypothetical protein Asp14428_66690 [Actinoplanes sp. NBRC 14428]